MGRTGASDLRHTGRLDQRGPSRASSIIPAGPPTRKRSTRPRQFECREGELYLDLGTLRCLAEVRLNGKDLGVLWCPPWRVEVTGLLEADGQQTGDRHRQRLGEPGHRRRGLAQGETSDLDFAERHELALKPDSRLIPSGLYGPVTLCIEER